MPFANAQALRFVQASGPHLDLVETAVARFNCEHPYLLFDKPTIPWIRDRANAHPKLIARLKASLCEQGSTSNHLEVRARIKRQSRRLIHTAFLALISDGKTKADALCATRYARHRMILAAPGPPEHDARTGDDTKPV